jgi:hypothetical protein
MATYNAADLLTKAVPGIDQGIVLSGTISPGTATATGDLLRPLKIPAGVKVTALLINVRTAFGATAPASLGFSHTDGSAVPTSVVAAAAQGITAATDTSLATTGTKLVMPQGGAFVTLKECYLEALFGTIATGAAGVADFSLLGEFVGSK